MFVFLLTHKNLPSAVDDNGIVANVKNEICVSLHKICMIKFNKTIRKTGERLYMYF